MIQKQRIKGSKKVNVAIIGYGYWGPNLVRNFNELENVKIVYCCDLREERLGKVRNKYPGIKTIRDYKKILRSKNVDAVIIATPLSSHYILAKQALLSGKHVWIEKPMTQTSEEARELIDLARKINKIKFVDHIFLYTEPVIAIKKIIDSKKLGDIYFFDSVRINLGLFQPDTNVLWDLAPHDISIMCYLLGKYPDSVSVFATSHIIPEIPDTAYLNFRFKNNVSAHVHVSWLSPVKIRRSIIAGNNKMVLYDDLESAESVKIYDRGVRRRNKKTISSTMGYQYRIGDILVPAIEVKEALHSAAKHFIECIQKNRTPLTNGLEGLKIVSILEAADISAKENGEFIKIKSDF